MIAVLFKAFLDWLLALGTKLLRAFIQKKQDESTNRENRERLEEAKTGEEQQQATEDLARGIGRKR